MADRNALTTNTSNLATATFDQAPVTGTDVGNKRSLDTVVLNTVTVTPSGDVEVVQPNHDDLNANANIQVGDTDVSDGNPVPVGQASGSDPWTVDGTVSTNLNDSSRTLTHTATTIGTTPATIVLTGAFGIRFYLADSASAGQEVYIRGTTTGTPDNSNAFVVRKFSPYELWMQPGEAITVTYEYVGSEASIPIIYEVFT